MTDNIARLLDESRSLLQGQKKPQFSERKTVLYEIMSSSEHRIFPSVHLWEPSKSALDTFVGVLEKGLKGESYYIAIHGHQPDVLCGGKEKWTQLCHMAFYTPVGIEKEAFDKRWKELYNASGEVNYSPPENRNRDSSNDSVGEGRVGLGGMEFTF